MNIKKQIAKEAILAIKNKVFPGCVVGIVYQNGERQIFPFGNFTYKATSPIVKKDTIYDVASITKSIPTGSLALQLIDEGKLKLSDKLIDYIPEFRNSDRDNVLIKHLLTYTIDGYGLASLKEKTVAGLFETLLTRDFDKRPGTIFKYTNVPAIFLGLVIEKITNKTLDNLANEHFFKPLKMTRSTFHPENFLIEEIAPTENDNWRGLVQGLVHDESAYIFKKEKKIVGHAGLFSTAPDILSFLEMLLHKGSFQGKKYFSEEIVGQMGTNQIQELNDFAGLGWELNQSRYVGRYCTPHTFGKSGFTGTLCVCDIKKGVAYVILSNRTFPTRPLDSSAINVFRKTIGDIVLRQD